MHLIEGGVVQEKSDATAALLKLSRKNCVRGCGKLWVSVVSIRGCFYGGAAWKWFDAADFSPTDFQLRPEHPFNFVYLEEGNVNRHR